MTNVVLCKVHLGEKEIDQLKHAIEELYYYEFLIGKFIFCLFLTKQVS